MDKKIDRDVGSSSSASQPQETNYISTFLGNRFYPLEGKVDRIDIVDICQGLSFQARFNGQANRFYSVAQHSIVVARLVPKQYFRAALLHDAAEAYLGDMVKPLKSLVPEFVAIEQRLMALIAEQFGVCFDDYAPIKKADLIALATEKRDLMPKSTEPWSYLAGVEPLKPCIDAWPPEQARQAFLEAWAQQA
jgi:hypothetical protein